MTGRIRSRYRPLGDIGAFFVLLLGMVLLLLYHTEELGYHWQWYRIPKYFLALSFFEGAYASEIIRAGIVSIPREQWDAAHGLGLSKWGPIARLYCPRQFDGSCPH